jgi:hypothetical protein
MKGKLLTCSQEDTVIVIVPKICPSRGNNPLYSVVLPNIYGKRGHFLLYSAQLPNITGFWHSDEPA